MGTDEGLLLYIRDSESRMRHVTIESNQNEEDMFNSVQIAKICKHDGTEIIALIATRNEGFIESMLSLSMYLFSLLSICLSTFKFLWVNLVIN